MNIGCVPKHQNFKLVQSSVYYIFKLSHASGLNFDVLELNHTYRAQRYYKKNGKSIKFLSLPFTDLYIKCK